MNELDGFRAEIDRIDTELSSLLELRFDLCEEIGRYKRMNGFPIENCEREKELVAARTEGMLSHRSDAVAVFRMIIRRAKRIQKEKLNLYLVGMPGSGKSRTARRLARAIEKPVADTDKLIIDKQGMSIDEIFDTHGEAFFREIESETLLGIAERGGHGVATGGGFCIGIAENGGQRHSRKSAAEKTRKNFKRVRFAPRGALNALPRTPP